MGKLKLVLPLALAFVTSGPVLAESKRALSPDEVSGLQEELKTCDKTKIGKVEKVRRTGTKVPNKEVAEWEYSIRLPNNKLVKTFTYPNRNDDMKRYIGQTVCAEDKDRD